MSDNYNIIRQQYNEIITIMSDNVNNGNNNNILQDNLRCGVFHKDHKRCKLESHLWPVWGGKCHWVLEVWKTLSMVKMVGLMTTQKNILIYLNIHISSVCYHNDHHHHHHDLVNKKKTPKRRFSGLPIWTLGVCYHHRHHHHHHIQKPPKRRFPSLAIWTSGVGTEAKVFLLSSLSLLGWLPSWWFWSQ